MVDNSVGAIDYKIRCYAKITASNPFVLLHRMITSGKVSRLLLLSPLSD